jgi:hypothetical protein
MRSANDAWCAAILGLIASRDGHRIVSARTRPSPDAVTRLSGGYLRSRAKRDRRRRSGNQSYGSAEQKAAVGLRGFRPARTRNMSTQSAAAVTRTPATRPDPPTNAMNTELPVSYVLPGDNRLSVLGG